MTSSPVDSECASSPERSSRFLSCAVTRCRFLGDNLKDLRLRDTRLRGYSATAASSSLLDSDAGMALKRLLRFAWKSVLRLFLTGNRKDLSLLGGEMPALPRQRGHDSANAVTGWEGHWNVSKMLQCWLPFAVTTEWSAAHQHFPKHCQGDLCVVH
ncbi:hypothetical protein MTO96_037406 [Rhipicephalus appendiculatus]